MDKVTDTNTASGPRRDIVSQADPRTPEQIREDRARVSALFEEMLAAREAFPGGTKPAS